MGLIFSRYEEAQCTMLMKSGAGAQDTGYLVSGRREWTGTGCRLHKLKTQASATLMQLNFLKLSSSTIQISTTTLVVNVQTHVQWGPFTLK